MNAIRSQPIRVDEIRDPDALFALEADWRLLFAQSPNCTPFQHPDWLIPWWLHFGADGGELRALALRRRTVNEELVGLVPLYIRREPDGARHLSLLGTGNTDYVDALAAPGFERALADMVAGHVARTQRDWDLCDLQPLPESSPLLAMPPWERCHTARAPLDVYPRLHLGTAADNLDAAIPPHFLARLRYARRRLERRGEVVVQRADARSVADCFEEVCRLHDARWKSKGECGVLADERSRRFHRDVAARMAADDLLRLYLLRVNQRPAAAFYGFARGDCLYYYIGGFDPAFDRESTGSLAVLAALEAAQRQGARTLDFLRGAEAYKYRWGAVDRHAHRLTIIADANSAAEAAGAARSVA